MNKLLESFDKGLDKILNESIKKLINDQPYMLRNDGEVFEVHYGDRLAFLDHPYLIHRKPEATIDDVKDIVLNNSRSIDWFYENTKLESTRRGILRFCNSFAKNINYFLKDKDAQEFALKKIDKYLNIDYPQVFPYGDEKDVIQDLENINDATNQEFLRFRTNYGIYNKNKYSIYFRVGSRGFDWSDLISKFIKDHYYEIDNITIAKDDQALGYNDSYKYEGENISCIPIENVELRNLPIIESLFDLKNKLVEDLKDGSNWLEHYKISSTRYLNKQIKKCRNKYE